MKTHFAESRITAAAFFSRFALCAFVIAWPPLAFADVPKELSGSPVVQDTGEIIVDGQKLTLWGITLLDRDQQCWTNANPWPCGEEALLTLKHIVEGKRILCRFKAASDDGKPAAQCFCQKGPNSLDVGRFMVKHGWALNNEEESSGYYEEEEDWAHDHRRGIWSGRFQMPQDWREGTSRFVDQDDDGNDSSGEQPGNQAQ